MQRVIRGEFFSLLSNPRLPEQVRVVAELIRTQDPIDVDEPTARRVMAPLLWMLDRIGKEGLALTKVGYLRPVDVSELMHELGWSDSWIGKSNREEQTAPARMLREAALNGKLARNLKGSLVLTPAGRKLIGDPVALWFYITDALPLEKDTGSRVVAGLELLSKLVATQQLINKERSIEAPKLPKFNTANTLTALGWGTAEGKPLNNYEIRNSWPLTRSLVNCLGIDSFGRRSAQPADIVLFLRSALSEEVPTDVRNVISPKSKQTGSHTLTITLDRVSPPVWRQIVVPSSITLMQLHECIQISMGWTRSHLFAINIGDFRYGYPDPDWDRMKDASNITLHKALPQQGSQAKYEYDFGDGWTHTITVDSIAASAESPAVLDGANACPPEDCGGPYGYKEFLEAQSDPAHERYEDFHDWLGYTFDPTRFNLAQVNSSLRLEGHSW
jgi:hypothetical protein